MTSIFGGATPKTHWVSNAGCITGFYHIQCLQSFCDLIGITILLRIHLTLAIPFSLDSPNLLDIKYLALNRRNYKAVIAFVRSFAIEPIFEKRRSTKWNEVESTEKNKLAAAKKYDSQIGAVCRLGFSGTDYRAWRLFRLPKKEDSLNDFLSNLWAVNPKTPHALLFGHTTDFGVKESLYRSILSWEFKPAIRKNAEYGYSGPRDSSGAWL